MFCRNCRKEVHEKAVVCPGCGVPPLAERKFCQACGAATEPQQVLCLKCSSPLAGAAGTKSRVTAGVLAILLGAFGVHKFYLGYTGAGALMLLVTVLGSLVTFGLASGAVSVIALVEGILYLTKSDADFERIYVVGKKTWF